MRSYLKLPMRAYARRAQVIYGGSSSELGRTSAGVPPSAADLHMLSAAAMRPDSCDDHVTAEYIASSRSCACTSNGPRSDGSMMDLSDVLPRAAPRAHIPSVAPALPCRAQPH